MTTKASPGRRPKTSRIAIVSTIGTLALIAIVVGHAWEAGPSPDHAVVFRLTPPVPPAPQSPPREAVAASLAPIERAGDRSDRDLWRTASPERMALTWATKVRPGRYRIDQVDRLLFFLIATVKDEETGQVYFLKVGPFDDKSPIMLEMSPVEE